MKNYRLQVAAAVCCIVMFFAVLGVAGDYDYAEQVVLRMSYDEYDLVKDTLTKRHGKEPSEREIAHWWTEHHSEYK